MLTTEVYGSTHETAMRSGIIEIPDRINLGGPVFYGTSDPVPNVSELVLTAIVAILCRKQAKFSVYQGGRTEYTEASERYAQNLIRGGIVPSMKEAMNIMAEWLGLQIELVSYEDVMLSGGVWGMFLLEMANEIKKLRSKPLRFCYVPENGIVNTIYTEGRWLKKNPQRTVANLHGIGGWLSGASIHYSLRRFLKRFPEHVNLVPWGTKGEVYQMYKDSGSRFVLAPALHIRPVGAEPEWLPLEFRTFAGIIHSWSDHERDKLREHLVSSIAEGLQRTTRSINLEFKTDRDYRIEVE